tara:strand:+ start:325 stop:897 length:573 start_codon:yes stop_codon:yes gene_type:complete
MVRKKIKPIKKKRKISAEQKEKLRARLAVMRAKKKPPEYKNVSKAVLYLPDDDPYSLKNVKEWIKHNKETISMLNARARNNEMSPKDKQHARNEADNKKAYIRYIEHYIKTGDWIGMFSGQNETKRVVPKCVAMAYHPDGTPKRTVGVFYPDIKMVWTQELDSGQNKEYIVSKPKTPMAKTDKQFSRSLV